MQKAGTVSPRKDEAYRAGGVPVTLDFAPFLAAAKLLYDGPWVAERYHLAGALIERQPDAVLPVIRDVLQNAPAATAVAAFDAQYKLQRYKAECDAMMADPIAY